MARASGRIDVYVEAGKKRALAGVIEWPGWARSGKNEAEAREALVNYGKRYAHAIRAARLGFAAPADASSFRIVERVKGNATTDYGVPGLPPSADARPVDEAEMRRFKKILKACWKEFDAAREAARGRELRKGPRGGGRDLDKIVRHVVEAEGGYLATLGRKLELEDGIGLEEQIRRTRAAILETLDESRRGTLPTVGPRGGVRWSARYFVRRSMWHVLDHAWEIEDRVE
jgi:hypothetical protein